MIACRLDQPENVMPTAVSLQKRLESIRQCEMDRVRGRLGRLSPEQQIAIEALTRGIINKVLHPTIAVLENSSAKNDSAYFAEMVHRIFNLGEKRPREGSDNTKGISRLDPRQSVTVAAEFIGRRAGQK
jgi:glutamyl-tRNA reductase